MITNLVLTKTHKFLKWSERYIKTDMIYLAKGGFWLFWGQIIISGVSLGSSIAFANLLSPEIYGKYRYILSIFNLLGIVTLLGVNSSLLKSVAQYMEGSLLVALKVRLKWAMGGAFIGLAIAGYYLFKEDYSLGINIMLMSLFVPTFYAFEVYTYFLRGKKLFREYAIFNSVTLAVPAISVILTLLLISSNLTAVIFSYFVPYIILKGLFLYLVVKRYLANKIVDPTLVSYGKHLSVMSVLSELSNNLDKLMLWHFLGPAQLAVYSLAVSPVNNLEGLVGKLELLIFPKIAQKKISELKKTIYGKMWRLFLPLILIVGFYILTAPFIYSLLFPKYAESVIYSQVFALNLLLLPTMFISSIFIAHSKIKERYYLTIIGPTSKLSLFLILIPLYGIWGVIISILSSQIILTVGNLVLFSLTENKTQD